MFQRGVPLAARAAEVCSIEADSGQPRSNARARPVAGLFLFIAANAFPFLAMKMQGSVTHTTLSTGVRTLYEQGSPIVASLVLLTTIVAPFLQISSLIFVLGPLRLGIRIPGQARVFRLLRSGAALEHDGSLHHGDPGFAGEIGRHGADRARDRALVVRAADSRTRGRVIVARRRVGLAAGWASPNEPDFRDFQSRKPRELSRLRFRRCARGRCASR